jgi:hypothetical protein
MNLCCKKNILSIFLSWRYLNWNEILDYNFSSWSKFK